MSAQLGTSRLPPNARAKWAVAPGRRTCRRRRPRLRHTNPATSENAGCDATLESSQHVPGRGVQGRSWRGVDAGWSPWGETSNKRRQKKGKTLQTFVSRLWLLQLCFERASQDSVAMICQLRAPVNAKTLLRISSQTSVFCFIMGCGGSLTWGHHWGWFLVYPTRVRYSMEMALQIPTLSRRRADCSAGLHLPLRGGGGSARCDALTLTGGEEACRV